MSSSKRRSAPVVCESWNCTLKTLGTLRNSHDLNRNFPSARCRVVYCRLFQLDQGSGRLGGQFQRTAYSGHPNNFLEYKLQPFPGEVLGKVA